MVQIFISYAHADEALRQELDKHLASLKHQGLIESWHDRRIAAGQAWADEIDANLQTADVILLLVSADFIASPYCYDVEMREAMRRNAAGQAVVIPVILRPCDWHDRPFGKLQAATRDGRAIAKYPTLDDGFLEVVQAIKGAAHEVILRRGLKNVASRKSVEAMQSRHTSASAGNVPRSSNMRVNRTFSDHDKDTFRVEAFEYIAAFFENSLAELEKRNPQLKTNFRRRDANSFEAAAYQNGKESTRCGIWLSSGHHFGEIGYSNSGLGNGNSYNESLSVTDDNRMLGLKPMGFGTFIHDASAKSLTLDGASEYLWSMFIRPLQES